MKKFWTKFYAWVLLIAAVAAICAVVAFAWTDLDNLIEAVVGGAASLLVAPCVHELGHVTFAYIRKLEIVYCKCFSFRYYVKDGKKRFGFASPFAPDETQVLPIGSENMEKRAYAYAIGGLVYSGVLFVVLLAASIVCWCFGAGAFFVYALLPYSAYLFLLNVLPAEYASGKTDALVARGIKKGEPVEQTMLNIMRIHGGLQEGKSFLEIPEEWYFSAPQIAEDEPLYVAILDARYSYYIEREEYEKAFDCLKRIKSAAEYLTDEEVLALERNLAYLCLVGGNDAVLKEAVKNDEEYWKSDLVSIKRTLALYMQKCGEPERAALLIEQAKALNEKERILGLKKHEEILLSRIN